jgi:hypothetical protein
VQPLRGAAHHYIQPRVIRTWGRRRLSLIEPLLPFATSVDIYLKGRGLPSFYAVKLPDMTFVLGLSGWSGQSWTDAGSFDLLGDPAPVSAELIADVHRQLSAQFRSSPSELAAGLGRDPEEVWRACERLCRQGRAVFDVETRAFRHRELFEEPLDEAKLFPPDPRTERAEALLRQNAVGFARCEPQETRKVKKLKTPDGPVTREIVYRDWRVTGSVATEKTEIVVGDAGRIIFGTCSCAFFQENLLGKGPCEHMIALFKTSADGRKDLPTSIRAAVGSVAPAAAKDAEDTEDTETEQEESEEDFDESEPDDKDKAR